MPHGGIKRGASFKLALGLQTGGGGGGGGGWGGPVGRICTGLHIVSVTDVSSSIRS